MKTRNVSIACLVLGLGLGLGGCYESISLDGNDDGSPASGADSSDPSGGGSAGEDPSGGDDSDGDPSGSGDGGEPSDDDAEDPFDVPGEEVRLLPFHVRIRNLSELVGVEEDDAIFTTLRAQRYQLGDHDYANGIAPDLRWDAQKMQVWVKAMMPVCDSTEFKTKYPDLLADPVPLLQQVYGRQPTGEEIASYDDVMVSNYDEDTRYRLACVSILSSLEFVGT